MPRVASVAPAIEGFTPGRLIGVGGYADVFLYEQHMPRREVAVKVLVADVVARGQQQKQFVAEANLMAKVSAHPYIVSVFQAAIAADGRPYIVMELYPGSNYLERVRRERFSVAEVLRTGVHIASAVETAHRAGIIHRDIKPANILTSEYGRPGLTDFGIATPDEAADDGEDGVSVPWAPPEAFGVTRLDERADVYSLSATVYHLLAGRSPFDVPGGANTPLDLMSRIERNPVPTTGRADVPAALERLLAHGMAKRAEHRPASAAEFGRLLQGVEAELRLAVTQLELADDGRGTRLLVDDDVDDATRVRGVTTIQAQPVRPAPPLPIEAIPDRPTGVGPVAQRRREGLLAEPEIEATALRPQVSEPEAPAPTNTGSRRRVFVAVGAGVASVVVGLAAMTVLDGGGDAADTSATQVQPVNDGLDDGESLSIASAPQPVTGLTGVANADGTFTFTWTAPPGAPADIAYQIIEAASGDRPQSASPPQSELSFTASVSCVEVVSLVSNIGSPPVPECVAA